eukprot:TRINITY_DN23140_c0_g1_i1.p1 TRINITY_DN23140_c0_g1~~TRINITY_DN23140_c0_g1_i1.p1  ORF type:complete len:330 (+),score=60.04 TRINITY_DN23140_c0_g1_i1:84-1073(+)
MRRRSRLVDVSRLLLVCSLNSVRVQATATTTLTTTLPSATSTGTFTLPSSTVTASDTLCGHPSLVRCHLKADCTDHAEVVAWNGSQCVCKCRNQWVGSSCGACLRRYDSGQDCGACASGYEGYPACVQRAGTMTVTQSPTTWLYPRLPTPALTVTLADTTGAAMLPTSPPLYCAASLERCHMNTSTGAVITSSCAASGFVWHAQMGSTGVCSFATALFVDPLFSEARRYRVTISADAVSQTVTLPAPQCDVVQHTVSGRRARAAEVSDHHNNYTVGGVDLRSDWRNRCPLCSIVTSFPSVSAASRGSVGSTAVFAALWVGLAVALGPVL